MDAWIQGTKYVRQDLSKVFVLWIDSPRDYTTVNKTIFSYIQPKYFLNGLRLIDYLVGGCCKDGRNDLWNSGLIVESENTAG